MLSCNALFVLIQYMFESSNQPKRNCLIVVNIILSRSRWATLYRNSGHILSVCLCGSADNNRLSKSHPSSREGESTCRQIAVAKGQSSKRELLLDSLKDYSPLYNSRFSEGGQFHQGHAVREQCRCFNCCRCPVAMQPVTWYFERPVTFIQSSPVTKR